MEKKTDVKEVKAKEVKSTPASVWQTRFTQRENKLKPLFEEARKYYDILYAVQKTKGMAPWKSKVYVPVLASKAWDLIARMSDVVPMFNVEFKNELSLDDAGNFMKEPGVIEREQRVQAKLLEDYQCSSGEPMKFKVFDPLVDAVAAGTGYAYASWKPEVKKTKARLPSASGLDNTKTVVKKVRGGKNDFEGINFFNVFPADGPSFQKAPYLIVRGFKPLYDMKASGRYKNLEKCAKTVPQNTQFQLDNAARNRVVNDLDATYIDDTVDMITYYECYERTADGIQLTVFAEGEKQDTDTGMWVEIKAPSYPYWHDLYPVVPFYCRRKSYSTFGESLFENNRTLQSATNDLFNHYLDNWNISIDSMIMYEDGSLTNDFVIEPGGEIAYTGEKPSQWKFPEPNPQQLSVVMSVLEKGIESATFSQYASGVPNSANDKTQGTAYGIKSITEAATTKIGFFRDNFKQSMKTVGQIWLSNLQQFENNPSEVTREVNGRPVNDVVLPTDYQGDAEVDIDDDSMVPLSKQEKIDKHERFVQSTIALQNQSITQAGIFKKPEDVVRINFHELFDDSARLYSIKDSQRYLLDSTEPIQQPQQPLPLKETPEGIALDGIAKHFDKLQPDIQAQVEQLAKLQPSSMHDSVLAHNAIKMGAEQAQIENQPLPVGGAQDGTGTAGTTGATTPTPGQ